MVFRFHTAGRGTPVHHTDGLRVADFSKLVHAAAPDLSTGADAHPDRVQRWLQLRALRHRGSDYRVGRVQERPEPTSKRRPDRAVDPARAVPAEEHDRRVYVEDV